MGSKASATKNLQLTEIHPTSCGDNFSHFFHFPLSEIGVSLSVFFILISLKC